MDRLLEKERIAKFLFAFRHVDRVIKLPDGTKKRLPSNKTQTKVATSLKVSFQQIQKYEKATNGIPSDQLLLLCRQQGYDVAKIFEGNPRDLLADIDKTKHDMVLKKFKDIELVIQKERELAKHYMPKLDQLNRELAYQDTFKS
tara:strand:+ start:4545 stop:4976 length:432 start_codon:yes stop_codon:yes gene_type:complete